LVGKKRESDATCLIAKWKTGPRGSRGDFTRKSTVVKKIDGQGGGGEKERRKNEEGRKYLRRCKTPLRVTQGTIQTRAAGIELREWGGDYAMEKKRFTSWLGTTDNEDPRTRPHARPTCGGGKWSVARAYDRGETLSVWKGRGRKEMAIWGTGTQGTFTPGKGEKSHKKNSTPPKRECKTITRFARAIRHQGGSA